MVYKPKNNHVKNYCMLTLLELNICTRLCFLPSHYWFTIQFSEYFTKNEMPTASFSLSFILYFYQYPMCSQLKRIINYCYHVLLITTTLVGIIYSHDPLPCFIQLLLVFILFFYWYQLCTSPSFGYVPIELLTSTALTCLVS